MLKLLAAVAIAASALAFVQAAEAQVPGNRTCGPALMPNGKSKLVCGIAPYPTQTRTCRQFYNTYTRRMQTIC
jgi:hypothetical protein